MHHHSLLKQEAVGFWLSADKGMSPGDLPNPGIEPRSPALQADSLLAEVPGKPPITPGHHRQPLGALIRSHLEAFFEILKAKRVSFVGPWCPVPAQS